MEILKISHPKELWILLKNREEIYESNIKLNVFMDYVSLWIDGCQCDEEINIRNMYDSFNDVISDSKIMEILENNLGSNLLISLEE